MCVICHFQPGYTAPKVFIENACHNNPHGFGLIIKRQGKLEVIRELPEKGNDPDVIYKLLKDNEDAERFLHVRWKTQGAVNLDNTQPFQVYNDRGREIWFMHNGTLSSYSPPYIHTNVQGQSNHSSVHDISDSRKFATTILHRFLAKFCGDNGIGDYQDDVVKEFIESKWSHGNKGLLVSNDLDPYYLGFSSWETIKTSEIVDGEEVQGSFFASNNDYFEKVKRGPLFERREEERRKKEAEARTKTQETRQDTSVDRTIVQLSCPVFFERFSLSEKLVDLLEDHDMYQPEGYIALANITFAEWITVLKNMDTDDVASLFLYLTEFLKKNTEKLEDAIVELNDLKPKKNTEVTRDAA